MRLRVLAGAWAALLLAVPALAGEVRIERRDPRFDALVPAGARLEPIAEGFTWLEGPVWDARRGVLLFSDVARNAVFRWRPGGAPRSFLEPSGYSGKAAFPGREPGSNGLAFDGAGRLVLAQHGDRRIARREPDGSLTVLAERYEGRRLNSPNDLVFSRAGDLYFTDPPFGLARTFDDPARELPWSGVYRLAASGELTLLTAELRAPNGIALSPSENTLYVSNSDAGNPVWMAYPLAGDGRLGPGRLLHDARAWTRRWPGLPDGMEVDAAGNLWAAGPGGVHVFAPDGAHLGSLVLGVATSNCAFGPGQAELYVTAGSRVYRVVLARSPGSP